MTRVLLALISSFLLALSFPLFDLRFLVWIGLVPFLLATRNRSLAQTLALSYLAGVGFFLGTFSCISSVKGVTVLHYAILGLYLGLYFSIFGLFFHLISYKTKLPAAVTAPPLWVSIEYLRSHAGFAALPMGLLGYTQHENLPLIQMASFTGAYGISFIIVLANAVIADLIGDWIEKKQERQSFNLRSGPIFRGTTALLIILALWITGYLSLFRPLSGKSFSIAVVQGNIPQRVKWDREYREQILSQYESLTEEAVRSKPQLIVWPETSTPGLILNDVTLLQRMVSMVRKIGVHFLVGSSEYPKFAKALVTAKKSGNTALFFSPEGRILGQYLKIYLVPFGEYVPYEGVIPWPKFIFRPSTNSYIAGKDIPLFSVDGSKLGTLICSETLYSELSRRMVKKGAEFLVNISNEAWFGKSAFPYQALSISVFRAVENRVNLVRCTNTGISCFIDPYGRIIARFTHGGQELFVKGTMTRKIILSPPGTFYSRHGDVFAYLCIAFSIAPVVWSFGKKIFSKKFEGALSLFV